MQPSVRPNLNRSTTPQRDSLELLPWISITITMETLLWPFRACLSQLPNLILKILKRRLDITQSVFHLIQTCIGGHHKFPKDLFTWKFPFFYQWRLALKFRRLWMPLLTFALPLKIWVIYQPEVVCVAIWVALRFFPSTHIIYLSRTNPASQTQCADKRPYTYKTETQ